MLTLYHTNHCPNCHAQEKILQQLQAEDPALQIHTVNLEESPEVQLVPAIQSVPTLLINDYRFEGLLTAAEIRQWLGPANHDRDYIKTLLKGGQLDAALAWLQQHPAALGVITELLADDALELTVRVGLDALIEQLAVVADLSALSQPLGTLLDTASDSLCIDILHYLAMIGSADAQQYMRGCLQHSHPEVRRSAQELLDELAGLDGVNNQGKEL